MGLDYQTQEGNQTNVEGLNKEEMDKGLCTKHSRPNRRKWKLQARAISTKGIYKFSQITSKQTKNDPVEPSPRQKRANLSSALKPIIEHKQQHFPSTNSRYTRNCW